MRKNSAVSAVQKIVETYGSDQKKLTAELKKMAMEGQKTGDLLLMGAAYCNLAENCLSIEDDYGAFTNAIKAVTVLKETKAHELLVRAYTTLGLFYNYQDNPQMAMSMDEIAYQLVKKYRIQGRIKIKVLNALSTNYHNLGDIQKAIRILTECLSLIEAMPGANLTNRAKYTLNLACYYKDAESLEKTREILLSMAPWIDQVDFQAVVADYYLRCAIVSYQLEDSKQGDVYADTALALLSKDICPTPVYDDLNELSHILSGRRDQVRAGKILEIMTISAEKNKGTIQLIFAYSMMADYYRAFGELERAVECYVKLEELYETQKRETRDTQLEVMKRIKSADAEIQKLKKQMQKNDEMVSLEPMTKLLNRSALLRVSAEFIESAAKKMQKVGAIFIDIDYFKECNDTYGHARGDEIIRLVAQACRKVESKRVRFARYGGDEFFGITRGLTDEEVCDIACRIAKTIQDANLPHVNNPNGGRVTLSVGVANMALTDRTNTILDIANNADKALYYAKSAGKNAIYQQIADGDNGLGVSYVKIEF